jgi:hypothetical protein
MKNKWPFAAWQTLAIRRFNLAPSEFWDMPVRDWLTLMDGLKSGGFDRAAFEELLKNYPDDGDENEPNG